MSGPKWTDENIERLRSEWATGVSIATIAQRLATTKSAVTGKAKRLGLRKLASTVASQRGQNDKPLKSS
jgi:GcrA cell cycle regulator